MRAMILAAGLGTRMGALTQERPKPLLKVAGRYLIEYSLLSLQRAGIKEVVINLFYHKEQIKQALGDGAAFGLKIIYSEEEERLETGGGVIKALPLLGPEPFILLSSDIICDYPLTRLFQLPLKAAHLIMVENPSFNLKGDYGLNERQELLLGAEKTYTFGNIALIRPSLFAGLKPEFKRIAHIWEQPLKEGQVTGECYRGFWYNVGTPQDLEAAELALKTSLPL